MTKRTDVILFIIDMAILLQQYVNSYTLNNRIERLEDQIGIIRVEVHGILNCASYMEEEQQ